MRNWPAGLHNTSTSGSEPRAPQSVQDDQVGHYGGDDRGDAQSWEYRIPGAIQRVGQPVSFQALGRVSAYFLLNQDPILAHEGVRIVALPRCGKTSPLSDPRRRAR